FDRGTAPPVGARARVGGRPLPPTPPNGTGAMLMAGEATVAAPAALTNVAAAAQWAANHRRDVTVLCAGEQGRFSLEDTACAGLLVAGVVRAKPEGELHDPPGGGHRLGLP